MFHTFGEMQLTVLDSHHVAAENCTMLPQLCMQCILLYIVAASSNNLTNPSIVQAVLDMGP